MHTSSDSLRAGLAEACQACSKTHGAAATFQLGWISGEVARLLEGNTYEKKRARDYLKKLIGRGRCILNAADLNGNQPKDITP